MAQIAHAFTSAKDDDPDDTLIRPSNWNADHKGLVAVRKTADETVNNSAALQNDDHLLFAIAANEVWAFDMWLITLGDAGADLKLAITVPASCVLVWQAIGLTEAATVGSDVKIGDSVVVSGTSAAFGEISITTRVMLHVFGTVENAGNAGNVQLQWAQSGATVADTKVLENSWLRASRIA